MEHKNGSGSNEHLNLQHGVTTIIVEEKPLDHDKMVGDASSSSFSSSAASSFSYQLELDAAENEMTYPDYEEKNSISPRSNLESPSTTPKLSVMTASPLFSLSPTLSPQSSDLNMLDASPIQSPPIQVMGQPGGYDPNRIPLSIFSPKRRNDSGWSLGSNESLFSIQMGSNSFSMDNGFYISKSGKLEWLNDADDSSCFTPDASKSIMSPAMMETAEENERKSVTSGEPGYEGKIEIQNASPIGVEKEAEISAMCHISNVPDGVEISPIEAPRNSESIARVSCESAQSTGSFAFPVLSEGSPTKVDAEKSSPTVKAETKPEAPPTNPKAGGNQWFHCFSCFPICC